MNYDQISPYETFPFPDLFVFVFTAILNNFFTLSEFFATTIALKKVFRTFEYKLATTTADIVLHIFIYIKFFMLGILLPFNFKFRTE